MERKREGCWGGCALHACTYFEHGGRGEGGKEGEDISGRGVGQEEEMYDWRGQGLTGEIGERDMWRRSEQRDREHKHYLNAI